MMIANSGFAPAHSFCFRRFPIALFKLPLSGDVVQWIKPVTWFASGNEISTNVYLGESSSPETEAEILDRVGTYGRQLGQIADATAVLLRHLPDRESLPRKESDAIKAFEKMANDIADIKEKHKRQAVRPEPGGQNSLVPLGSCKAPSPGLAGPVIHLTERVMPL